MKYVMLIEYESRVSRLIIYDSELDVHSGQPKKIIVIDEHFVVKQTAIDDEMFCLKIYKNPSTSVILAYDSLVETMDWRSSINEIIERAKSLQKELPSLIPPRRIKQKISKERQIKTKRINEG